MNKGGAKTSVAVIGIGSPFGNDAAGLEVARRLAGEEMPGVEVIAADRPGLDLLDLLDDRESVILIDAARSPGGRAGTVYEINLRRLAWRRALPVSSHGFGVAAALALAARLGRLPPSARLLAIDIGQREEPRTGLSPAVQRAVGRVVARVRRSLQPATDAKRLRARGREDADRDAKQARPRAATKARVSAG